MAKKEEKEDEKNEYRQLRDTIYTFMYYCNKPIIGTELLLQFKGQKKATVEKVLDDLVAKEKLFLKLFGKSKIYCLSQSMEFTIGKEYTDKIDSEQDQNIEYKTLRYLKWSFEENTKLLNELKIENKRLSEELAGFENEMSVEELKASIKEMNNLIKIDKENQKEGKVTVDPKEFAKIKKTHAIIKKENINRNSIFKNIVDSICDGTGIKKKDFLKDAGIDD